MIVVEGKKTREIDAAYLHELLSPYPGVTVDLGTGDGRFAYRYAAARPDRFVIGIDPVTEAMAEMSARARRKPERGGLANLLYVVASIERMPSELQLLAHEIFVNLPWGSLMRGIVLGDDVVLGGIARISQGGAVARIVLNTRIFDDPVPIEARDLPELTPEYVRDTLSPGFARHGITIDGARCLSAEEVATMETTWAKRLSHRSPPPSLLIEAHVTGENVDVGK
jgi:16S rRNA (adenine(1408)-N(1))-methyltransferase